MWDMFPEVVGTESYRKYHEAMRERRAVEFESYFAPSGEWFEARAYPSDGGLAIYYREVSEGKRAEYQMREAEAAIFESITDAFFLLDSDWRFAYVNERALHELGRLLGGQLERETFLGQSLWEVFPAVLGTEAEAIFRRTVRQRESVLFEYLYPASGTWIEVHAYPSDEGLSVYFRNIDDRKRAERDRERQARQQEAVARLGVKGLASDDLQPLMDEAVELVAERLEVELSSIGRLLPGGRRQVLAAGVGWGSGAVGSATAPAGPGSLIGYTIATGAPVLSDDLAADDRFFVSPLLTGRGVVSAAHVLIPGRERPFGTLGAFAKQPRAFSAADASFLQAVANVISTAVERADVEERVNEVRETERRRIARDLHDDALRDLTHALAVASRDESLGELVAALKRVGQQLRGAIYDLRLTGEQDRTLLELLTEMVELHRAMAPELEIRVDRGQALPSGSMGDRGTEILRILSEAITNARRHSGASVISVDIAATDGMLCFDVSDDGSGAALAEAVTGGGRGMIERADLLGAQLEVEAIPGGGTTVSLRLPVGEALEGAVERTCVLLVEDHTSVREAMAAAFEREPDFEVVGQAASLAEARLMLGNIDVALIDLGLPDGYGADLIAELREANPSAQALVLSASLDRADLARAVQKGAAGALNKNVHLYEVVDAVRRLRSGETLLPMQEVVELLRYAGRREAERRDDLAAIERLTPREREVLQGLADGLDSRQIAEALHITLRTQRNHVASILSKLGVHSQLQALIFALRYEVVQIS
jgi:DNA-binding NarL/FixJ family response regulator/signal transduction histidine kinase